MATLELKFKHKTIAESIDNLIKGSACENNLLDEIDTEIRKLSNLKNSLESFEQQLTVNENINIKNVSEESVYDCLEHLTQNINVNIIVERINEFKSKVNTDIYFTYANNRYKYGISKHLKFPKWFIRSPYACDLSDYYLMSDEEILRYDTLANDWDIARLVLTTIAAKYREGRPQWMNFKWSKNSDLFFYDVARE